MAARTFKKLVATSLTTDFRKAAEIVTAKTKQLLDNEVLIKMRYAGINATDINVTAGRYTKDPKLPMDIGLEGVGEVVEVGTDISKDILGKAVGYIGQGSYAEYLAVPAKYCLPLPDAKPEFVPLLISGLSASISLEELGRIKSSDKVLVTAAAGGTGHLAVQYAKHIGCHVTGTCSSQAKVDLLKSLGCDHVINYTKEDIGQELKALYPDGIDVIYESVGGDTFNACSNRLATKARMIVLGYISNYNNKAGIDRSHRNATLMTKLLMKSATVSGFYLFNHPELFKSHLVMLANLVKEGRMKPLIDQKDSNGKPFIGIESIYDAVDHLYARKNQGKVVMQFDHEESKL